ncbi:MAG: CoA-binding protein [Desulfobacteraceae bacterium]|nr:MAG: CoA-binding protein [Desulfobacteraceae bacterium]
MDNFFYPQSLLIAGVSEEPTNLGRVIVRNLEHFSFKENIYLLGRKRGNLGDRPIYTSLEDIPVVPELAVILTPAKSIPGILDACGRKGIRQAIIESGGFGEYSEEGKEIEEEIKRVSERYGIRFVGPNCIGILNLENGLNTSFVAGNPEGIREDPISFISQSGGLVNEMLKLLSSENIGFNKLISIGNKLNLTENEVLEYLLQDPKTSVIGLYLESIFDGNRLIRLAEASEKPVIALKANIIPGKSGVARFHTSALAGDDRICSAGLAQAGIHRVSSMDELISHFKIFTLPPMSGQNLAILGQSGGGNVLAADAAAADGFSLPDFSETLLDRLRQRVRAGIIRFTNPLDLGDLLDLDFYAKIVEEILKEDRFDGILLRYYFREAEKTRRFIDAVERASRTCKKPVALCLVASREEWLKVNASSSFPLFSESKGAMKALSASYRHRKRKRASSAMVPLRDPDPSFNPPVSMNSGEVFSFLKKWGLPVPDFSVVHDLQNALSAARRIGYPVALKIASSEILHKTEAGGVKIGIKNDQAFQAAFKEMYHRFSRVLPETAFPFIVQKMVPSGVEVILGAKRDMEFGPVVLFGLGGLHVEVFGDTSLRVAPVSEDQALEMINEIKGSRLLKGFRGKPPVDMDSLKKTIVAFSKILVYFSEIQELEINPLILSEKCSGCSIVDARMRRNSESSF